eukprot:6087107-Amphidinium_carterae.1
MRPRGVLQGGLNRLREVDIRRDSAPLCRVLTSAVEPPEGVASSTLCAMRPLEHFHRVMMGEYSYALSSKFWSYTTTVSALHQ